MGHRAVRLLLALTVLHCYERYRPMVMRSVGLSALVGLAALVTAAAMNRWVSRAGSAGWCDPKTTPPLPVAIVLGARVYRDGTVSLTLEDRLQTAVELYRTGKVQRILVSGDHRTPANDEPLTMRRWLLDRGVPDQDIFLDHAGFRTLDTMQRAARVFQVRQAAVCTQEFHLARALFLARRAGIEAIGVPADRRRYRYHYQNRTREFFARARAFVDSYVWEPTRR